LRAATDDSPARTAVLGDLFAEDGATAEERSILSGVPLPLGICEQLREKAEDSSVRQEESLLPFFLPHIPVGCSFP